MTILKKRLATALTLALSVMLISAPLALAETAPSVESTEATSSEGTPEGTEVSADPEIVNGEQVVDNDEPADGTENDEVVPPGTLPDSPFYWLTILIEKLQVTLTFDPVEKTELLEEQGLERIAEATALIEQGDTELAEATLNSYTEKVAEAQAFIAQLAETDSETRLILETALSKTSANNVQTLGGLLEKLPSQAAQRVALNIVRSMEKSISKMEKKDQHMVAQELKKATKGIEDDELAEEDEEALENLDQTLEESKPDEDIVAAAGTLSIMALTTDSLTDTPAQTSSISSQSLVQNTTSKVTKPKLEAKVELQPTESIKPQEQKQENPQDAAKVLEQKQQDDKLKAERESALKEENQSLNNSAQKQAGEEAQQKAQKEREKGAKSGGKER